MKSIVISLVLTIMIIGCAEMKQAGRDIGHATRDTTKAIGHASRNAVKSVKEDLSNED